MDGKVIAPQVIDQQAGRHGSPQAKQEISQQGSDLCLANLDQLPSSAQAASAPSTPKRTRSG
jgi:hypothetical protein